jgi:putative CocE/NonD family hydrolase
MIEQNVPVKMRDGVILRADVYRPKGNGPFPTLVYRTPYGKDFVLDEYPTTKLAVARGYAVVLQDVRGRYHSDGDFRAYETEGRDGYDTIEWAAKQPWSNGNVGTFGLSYPGAVQWLAAIESPPHLKAMVPAMTFASPRNFFYSNGTFDNSWSSWIYHNIAPDARKRKDFPGPKNYKEAAAEWPKQRDRILGTLPMSALPDFKQAAPFYYDWMKHPPEDPWWEFAELRGKYGKTNAAVLNYSGWYDESYGPHGAVNNYLGLLDTRKGESDPRTQVIIGPWVHGTASVNTRKAGDRDFGPNAGLDYDALVLDWMDHYVKGDTSVRLLPKPIRLFVMGTNRWRDSDTWPLSGTQFTSFYLVGRESHKDGTLANQPASAGPAFTQFVSDPANPVTDKYESAGAHDYSSLAKRSDVIVFDTEPLPADTEVTGPISAEIFLSVDAPDTDLWVRLLDVAPDGTALNLMSPGNDVVRASYRDGKRELLTPGEVYSLKFDKLVTSNLFAKGHRIRVQISTSFFPPFTRNLHTGKSEFFSAEMRKATVRIRHSEKYPSRVILPIIPEKQ